MNSCMIRTLKEETACLVWARQTRRINREIVQQWLRLIHSLIKERCLLSKGERLLCKVHSTNSGEK